MCRTALIVAGGKGLRMGSELPKQFLPIDGKPVLMRTLEAFHRFDEKMQIILVLPREQQDFWRELCEEHGFDIKHQIADGGETRFHSVKNGLALVNGIGVVGIHDGVRPFVSQEVIARCFREAVVRKAVIPVIDVVETPQVFDADLLKRAYEQEFTPFFTDDASVVEAMGVPVYLVEGNRENIKITTPFDLKVASALL